MLCPLKNAHFVLIRTNVIITSGYTHFTPYSTIGFDLFSVSSHFVVTIS